MTEQRLIQWHDSSEGKPGAQKLWRKTQDNSEGKPEDMTAVKGRSSVTWQQKWRETSDMTVPHGTHCHDSIAGKQYWRETQWHDSTEGKPTDMIVLIGNSDKPVLEGIHGHGSTEGKAHWHDSTEGKPYWHDSTEGKPSDNTEENLMTWLYWRETQ